MGEYTFSADTLAAYTIRVDTMNLPFTVSCPTGNSLDVDLSANTFLSGADVALQCNSGFDLGVQNVVRTTGLFFPGQTADVSIYAGDFSQNYLAGGCNVQGLSGTVTASISGPVSVVDASGNASFTGNTVVWNVSDFSVADFFHDYWIRFATDTSAQSGEQVCVAVSVTPASDSNPLNNSLTYCFTVDNSFDPNFKEVYPRNWHGPDEWHSYTVHFQNTGTAPAQHVRVIDTLDANLDWSSFQLLAYSHDNLTQVLQDGVVHFNFPNINLPDSTSDEPNSHGWIQYRIKTKADITAGTTIHNTASIYFDFNTPVVTNDAPVTYCLPVETQQSFSICQGDSVQVGANVYHQAGTYTNLFVSSSGCDSSVVTTVNVASVDTSITVGNASLFANGNASSYQWYDCNANQPITGATNQTYTPLQNGSYTVQLTYGSNCSTMSSCVNLTIIGIDNIQQGGLNVYPNPSDGEVYFDLTGFQGTLTVYNALGQVIRRVTVSEPNVCQ